MKRKVYEVSGLILMNDGACERLHLKVRACNEEKAKKFFKQDICNLKYIYEWQILNCEIEG